jgi:hypothetical protein
MTPMGSRLTVHWASPVSSSDESSGHSGPALTRLTVGMSVGSCCRASLQSGLKQISMYFFLVPTFSGGKVPIFGEILSLSLHELAPSELAQNDVGGVVNVGHTVPSSVHQSSTIRAMKSIADSLART